MRSVDLAIYADTLAGEHTALAARLEQARARLREAAIEREVRASLDAPEIVQLESLGILGAIDERTARGEVRRLTRALDALSRLQVWVEGRLAAEREQEEAVSAA